MRTPVQLTNARFGCRVLGVALLGACVLAGAASAAEEAAAKKDAKAESTSEDYRSWFDLSVGGSFLKGDEGQFRRQQQTSKGAFGGVQDFHYEQDLGKKGVFKLDGRGIFDNRDYLLQFEVSHPDYGYVRAGYREFRTWYDGSGGFFPPNGAWFAPTSEALATDRGEYWVEGGLTRPKVPQLGFEYRHQFRDGMKDSLSWGDTALTGLAGATGARGLVPSFWKLDEKRDIFAGDLKHNLGRTELGLGVRYETTSNTDSLETRRRPGEGAALDRYVTQTQGEKSDMFNAHAFSETRFTDKTVLTVGASYTTLDSDLSGSRIYGPTYEAVYDPTFRKQYHDEGFLNLNGGSEMRQYVLNLNFMWNPASHVTVVPSVRLEKNDVNSVSGFLSTDVGRPPLLTRLENDMAVASQRGFVDVSEELEIRYTGLTNWVFYARGGWVQGDGDLQERETALRTASVTLDRDTDFTQFSQKYTAGANWYPAKGLNFSAQYYHKQRVDDYSHNVSVPLTAYPGFIQANEFDTDDVNFRVSWRPRLGLSFVTRYDFQRSTIRMTELWGPDQQDAQQTSHILSETVTWSPIARLYLQGGGSYVLDKTDTPADGVLGATQRVLDAKNDYWNVAGTIGYALGSKTDVQATYIYYRARDFQDNSLASQPYGVGAEEHGVTAALLHRLRKNLLWTLKYGYFDYRDQTSGGHNNYQAHLVYSSWQYRF